MGLSVKLRVAAFTEDEVMQLEETFERQVRIRESQLPIRERAEAGWQGHLLTREGIPRLKEMLEEKECESSGRRATSNEQRATAYQLEGNKLLSEI